MTSPRIILASSSAYRRAQLANIGFQVPGISPNIDETATPGEAPDALACRLAAEKARAVAANYPDAVIIGGDQVATVTDKTGHVMGGRHPVSGCHLRHVPLNRTCPRN